MADFDWQIKTLFRVLGATHPAKKLTNANLAKILLIEPSGVTQRRNGSTPLRIGDAAAIIQGFGLGVYGLTDKLFDITDEEAFRRELCVHGVGVYEADPRRSLARRLDENAAESGLSITLRRTNSRRERGVAYVDDGHPENEVFHIGERVEIVVRATEGKHVAVLQFVLDIEHAIETLAPIPGLPDTLMVESVLSMPGMVLRKPAGRYRLMVVEGSETLIRLFGGPDLEDADARGESASRMAAVRLSDSTAQKIIRHLELHPKDPVRTATVEFIVM
ncbi:hypothetical protein [Zavarzinia compransoris]|uniref:Uncharacterized protein n=1 Tax=Zavarzinia compransoris TaxID=1264899 RepID=A0A317DWD3_9PROT|nr:hypothetical protein [Zavarzinia compransoris]PWR18999.1 hypothetical protein DKG75_18705 [Zavarzinia compransoris]TDP49001.1 hypothetical protein DES42_101362 [Zavarzinia compransoris]